MGDVACMHTAGMPCSACCHCLVVKLGSLEVDVGTAAHLLLLYTYHKGCMCMMTPMQFSMLPGMSMIRKRMHECKILSLM